jgi:hypothetical protein
MIRADADLALLWLPSWERASGETLESSYRTALQDLRNDMERLTHSDAELSEQSDQTYAVVAEALGGCASATRGSGTKTALLAAYAAFVWSKEPSRGLRTIANALGTDTDTIGTMAGALLGVLCDSEPPETTMDTGYLTYEADRLYDISQRKSRETFAYPDLLYWRPPKARTDIVGKFLGEWVVAGLGEAKALDELTLARKQKGEVWQWFELNFGQNLLIKRREPSRPLSKESVPLRIGSSTHPRRNAMGHQTDLGLAAASPITDAMLPVGRKVGIDEATDLAIKSGFDPNVVGTLLMKIAEGDDAIEKSVAYAAIIAKAKQARLKRSDRPQGH